MSSKDLAVSVRGLSKSYVIAHNSNRPTNFREVIVDRIRHPLGNGRQDQETFWALKDVDFEIARGGVIGIIGRNGAGKSTLLKILSRITWPTTGEIDIYGRVSSLLEVGTGFHGELTGRENIFLNGTILGMSRGEIKRKFDEIVEFSGVEQFLDTPVKRYSSGMYVRLAFAVAAHLEPEILIVDEVLAVGDAQFQRKCLGKMQEISEGQGRTILFVSHNMASINQLCSRGILLRDGQIAFDGSASDAVQGYFKLLSPEELGALDGLARATLPACENSDMRLLEVRVKDEEGNLLRTDVPHDGPMLVEIDYEVIRPLPDAYVACCFTDLSGADAWWQYDAETPLFNKREPGIYRAKVEVPAGFLRAGTYHVRPSIVQLGQKPIDYHGSLFHVTLDDRHSVLARKGIQWPSMVQAATRWSTEEVT